VQLDKVLGLAAGAVARVVAMFAAATLERSDNEADIEAERADVDLGDDPPASVAVTFLRHIAGDPKPETLS
jgi:hypothetical protein